MDRRKGERRWPGAHRHALQFDGLELRKLLSSYNPFSRYALWPTGSYYSSSSQISAQAAFVRHEYDRYVGELKTLELKSQVTIAEYLALRDDARAISIAAAAADLPPTVASDKATEVSLELDRSALYGRLGDSGWSLVSARLSTNLVALAVPPALVAQTLADMKTLAESAGVTASEFQTYTNDFNGLRDAESSLPPGSFYHFEDPGLYYTQHLRGFFRGWGFAKVAAADTLKHDLQTPPIETGAGFDVVRRGVRILKAIGAILPSASNQELDANYIAAFDKGSPSAEVQSTLRSTMLASLGSAADSARSEAIHQLVADTPAFYEGLGSSSTRVRTIVLDIESVVNSGGGESLNPFKIAVARIG
jgi:hypothetical protein